MGFARRTNGTLVELDGDTLDDEDSVELARTVPVVGVDEPKELVKFDVIALKVVVAFIDTEGLILAVDVVIDAAEPIELFALPDTS